MIKYKKKFLFLQISEVWFNYKFNFLELIGFTNYQHIKTAAGKINGIRQRSFTIENNLEMGVEEIFEHYSRTVKGDINQAEKLGIKCVFQNDLNGFVSFYNKFAGSRKIGLVSESRLRELGRYLNLSFATFNGEIIAAHGYIADEEMGIVRLTHSATVRLNENSQKRLSGKINKWLHYKDMLHFKDKGFRMYDFGGYTENTTDKGLMGINDFKLSFGGEKVICNNYSSIGYFFLKKIAALFGLLGKD